MKYFIQYKNPGISRVAYLTIDDDSPMGPYEPGPSNATSVMSYLQSCFASIWSADPNAVYVTPETDENY